MDLDVSIEELHQTIIGIVAQILVQTSAVQDERRAVYEILQDVHLTRAISAIKEKVNYELPYELTLMGQKN